MRIVCLHLSRLIGMRLALVLCVTGLCGFQPAQAGFNLFNSKEEISSDLSAFSKWNEAVERDRTTRIKGKGCKKPCPKQQWEALIADLKSVKGKMAVLRRVHERVNEHPYITDIVNWGIKDYWATPFQFLRVNGDCEDYAIAKYMALKTLGWKVDDMRIVVLQDNHLNILHSVLAVEASGGVYILDNQIDQLITHRKINHYRPIYSINEHSWWRHTPK